MLGALYDTWRYTQKRDWNGEFSFSGNWQIIKVGFRMPPFSSLRAHPYGSVHVIDCRMRLDEKWLPTSMFEFRRLL